MFLLRVFSFLLFSLFGYYSIRARACGIVTSPAELRQPDVEVGQFRRLLKTFLFARDCGA